MPSENRLAPLDPTADAVPPLMVPRVAQVLGGQLPAVSPKYPNVSHQEQNHTSSHFYLLICNIGAITLRKSKAQSEPPIELGSALCFSRRRSFIPAAVRK